MSDLDATGNTVMVWDPLIRVFHWTLVLSFFVAYVSEDDLLGLHVLAGYLILGLLVFRLLWGVVGSRHARFTDFVMRPRRVAAYLKSVLGRHPKRYLGHNPAGGAMVMALLVSLILTTVTGFAVYGAEEMAGPMASTFSGVGDFWADVLEEGHEVFANFTLMLVFIHVLGVLLASFQHRENLVRAMVNGYKLRQKGGDAS